MAAVATIVIEQWLHYRWAMIVCMRVCCHREVGVVGVEFYEALHVPGVFEHATAEQHQHLGAGKIRTVLRRLPEIFKMSKMSTQWLVIMPNLFGLAQQL